VADAANGNQETAGMNGIDVALVVLLLLTGLRGSWRGIFREGFGFVALVIGLLAALRGAETVAGWLGEIVPALGLDGTALLGTAFVIVFIVVSGLINLIGVACDQLFGRGALRGASRASGALFACGKGAVVLAFVMLFLHLFPVVPGIDRQIMDSRIGKPMVSAAGAVLRSGWRDGAAESQRT
jgi:membrane protein required for colicin V production